MTEASDSGIQEQLRPGERVVSNFGPYYATSDRILLYLETRTGTIIRELPYPDLEGVEEVKVGRPRLVLLGATIAIVGLLATTGWGIIFPIIGLAVGIPIALYGVIGRPAYYQLHSRAMPVQDIPYWRLRHRGAGSFLSSVRTIRGEAPPRPV